MNWLFLRGLTREQRHWMNFPEIFQKKNAESKVFCLDLAGVGTERARPCPSTIHKMMLDLRQRWQSLSSSGEAWALLGHSLGGMISLEWLSFYPDDFKKAVLINTSAGNLSPLWERLFFWQVPNIIKAGIEKKYTQRENLILQMTSNLRSDKEFIIEKWAAWAEETQISRKTALIQILAAIRYKAPIKISHPLLVLCSAGDQFVNPKSSTQLAAHYKASLEIHPTAGHDLCLDAPEWVSEKVLRAFTP